MDDILAKFGLKIPYLITGAIAGVMGMVFNNKPRTTRQKIRSYVVVISGAVLTGYLTPLVFLYWEDLRSAEYSVAFILGLFGMGLIETIFVILNKLKDNPIDVIKSIRNIFK